MSLRDLLKGATKRPWVAFQMGQADRQTLAIMKGPRPPRSAGRFVRWPEIVAWNGFDGADVPKAQRRANLHLIVGAVNALPQLLDALDEAAVAIDVADAIIAAQLGPNFTMKEWEDAKRRVQRARAKLP